MVYQFIQQEEPLSFSQVCVLWTISAVTGVLSIIGSSLILYYILRYRKWRTSIYHRLVMGISGADIVLSTWVLSAYACFPKEVGFHLTFGNDYTCTISGFLAIFGAASTNSYNMGLSFHFLTTCCGGWRDGRIIRYVEIPTHVLGLVVSLAIPSIAAYGRYINTTTSIRACLFGSEPPGCSSSETTLECDRGGDDDILYNALRFFHLAILLVSTTLGIVNMVTISLSATRQLRRGIRASVAPVPQLNERIHSIRSRSILYCLSHFNTTLWSAIVTFGGSSDAQSVRARYPLAVTAYVFFPLQGFLNALIFFYPLVKSCKKRHNPSSTVAALRMVLGGCMDSESRQPSSSQGSDLIGVVIARLRSRLGISRRNLAEDESGAIRSTTSPVIETIAREDGKSEEQKSEDSEEIVIEDKSYHATLNDDEDIPPGSTASAEISAGRNQSGHEIAASEELRRSNVLWSSRRSRTGRWSRMASSEPFGHNNPSVRKKTKRTSSIVDVARALDLDSFAE